MRYIGLDLGNRTVGVAVSDSLGKIATADATYRFKEKDLQKALEYVTMIVHNRKIDAIVMGLPKNMDGSLGFQADFVLEFKVILETELHLPVFLFDERLTTIQVQRIMSEGAVKKEKKKERVDTLAATLILQSYLDSING